MRPEEAIALLDQTSPEVGGTHAGHTDGRRIVSNDAAIGPLSTSWSAREATTRCTPMRWRGLALHLTRDAVRTHLAALERAGLLKQRGARRGVGKPAYAYRLMPRGGAPLAQGPWPGARPTARRPGRVPGAIRPPRSCARNRASAGDRAPGERRACVEPAAVMKNELGGLAKLEEDDRGYLVRGWAARSRRRCRATRRSAAWPEALLSGRCPAATWPPALTPTPRAGRALPVGASRAPAGAGGRPGTRPAARPGARWPALCPKHTRPTPIHSRYLYSRRSTCWRRRASTALSSPRSTTSTARRSAASRSCSPPSSAR